MTKDVLVEWLEMFYGDPSMVFSSLLRSMIIPDEGKELYVADFSKIEVAVLWWLSDNKPGLEILNSGRDPYKYMASSNTGKPYEEIEDEGDERQLGKAQVLGCGFGMGWEKFKDTAWEQYRLKLTDQQAKDAVKSYRDKNSAVTDVWKNYEAAAIAAIENPGKAYKTGKCIFFVRKDFLWVELPSKRRLAYRNPTIGWRVREYEVTEYCFNGKWYKGDSLHLHEDEIAKLETRQRKVKTEPQKTIEFWAVNSKTKKWNQERSWGGTMTENIVQAVARDLMMPAMVRLDKKGYQPLLMVHDEGICEKEIGSGSVEEFEKIMCERPAWADETLPLGAKGWKGPRYRK